MYQVQLKQQEKRGLYETCRAAPNSTDSPIQHGTFNLVSSPKIEPLKKVYGSLVQSEINIKNGKESLWQEEQYYFEREGFVRREK